MTIKRISLVTPPYHAGVVESAGTWLNLGFVTMAGGLRQAGLEVDYYDAMALWHDWEAIEARLQDFAPDLVATTAFTAALPDALLLLERAKAINPGVVTVIGNVHPTCRPEEVLNASSAVDFVVRGEGETTLVNLVRCLAAGDDPARVRGLAFRRHGGVMCTPSAPFIADLDTLIPAWDLVEWPHYSYRPLPGSTLAIVSSSRGCRQNCSFCSQKLFWQRTWRARSPEHFVAELEMLRSRHGVSVVMLADELPTLDRDRWERILDLLIERDLGMTLLMETRVDDILRDAAIMDKYRQAGVDHIYVGVEAGSQALLDLFKKGTRVAQSKAAIDIINKADIVSETSFVLGMPDETSDSIAATVELAKEYGPDMAFFLAIAPWPYADLYPVLRDHIVSTDYRHYNLVEPVVKPRAMEIDELKRELGRAAQQFYMDRFQRLEKLSSRKQAFMIEVLKILVGNSYLAGHMRQMAGTGAAIPDRVRGILNALAEGQRAATDDRLAPIP